MLIIISHCIEDFIDTPRSSNQVIKGFGGSKTAEFMTGTICWRWEDDNGMVHVQTIPNSYYGHKEMSTYYPFSIGCKSQ